MTRGDDIDRMVATRTITRTGREGVSITEDVLAVEEPLEIRAAGDPVAMTMRTPGRDADLAAGFLFAEGIVSDGSCLGRIYHCGQPGSEGYGNTIDVLPAPGTAFDVDRVLTTRRGTLTTSACGVCGRQSIDDLLARCRPFGEGPTLERGRISGIVKSLRDAQPAFDRTGGLHGAAAFSSDGAPVNAAEDIGRHNAVDKVVGRMLLAGSLGEASVLAVSGRASFEIVQKAAAASIPIVVAVSAASTLAADLSSRLGMTLVGFARGECCNVYAGQERLTD